MLEQASSFSCAPVVARHVAPMKAWCVAMMLVVIGFVFVTAYGWHDSGPQQSVASASPDARHIAENYLRDMPGGVLSVDVRRCVRKALQENSRAFAQEEGLYWKGRLLMAIDACDEAAGAFEAYGLANESSALGQDSLACAAFCYTYVPSIRDDAKSELLIAKVSMATRQAHLLRRPLGWVAAARVRADLVGKPLPTVHPDVSINGRVGTPIGWVSVLGVLDLASESSGRLATLLVRLRRVHGSRLAVSILVSCESEKERGVDSIDAHSTDPSHSNQDVQRLLGQLLAPERGEGASIKSRLETLAQQYGIDFPIGAVDRDWQLLEELGAVFPTVYVTDALGRLRGSALASDPGSEGRVDKWLADLLR